jgi:hypothetical protein
MKGIKIKKKDEMENARGKQQTHKILSTLETIKMKGLE